VHIGAFDATRAGAILAVSAGFSVVNRPLSVFLMKALKLGLGEVSPESFFRTNLVLALVPLIKLGSQASFYLFYQNVELVLCIQVNQLAIYSIEAVI
jgi:hypothetical protein